MVNLSKIKVANFAKWPLSIQNICSTTKEANEIEVVAYDIDVAVISMPWYVQPSFYQCQLCKYEGEKKDMWHHVQKVHRLFKCSACCLVFGGSANLEIHAMEHYTNEVIGGKITGYRIKRIKN